MNPILPLHYAAPDGEAHVWKTDPDTLYLYASNDRIMGGGMERPMALANNLVMDKAEVIATYVYKVGIKGSQFSLTTAVGLFQSVVGVILILGANWISRKLGERGIW